MDQQGLAVRLEDLSKPSGSDVQRAAEVFRYQWKLDYIDA